MSKQGCALWLVIASILAFFVWANATADLAQFGTVQHVDSDGETHENPTATLGMLVILCVFVGVVAVMLTKAEKKAQDDVLLAPVARVGCGKSLAMLAVLCVCGLLAAIASMMGGL